MAELLIHFSYGFLPAHTPVLRGQAINGDFDDNAR